jgi:predicted NUDIX family NTP pyrophosphohydrolase
VKKENRSAGILLYRINNGLPEVLLVHPGGPFWKNKDQGAWTIPKGELDAAEHPEDAARREFFEETGFRLKGKGKALKPVKQKAGKWIEAWMMEGDLDASAIKSNVFELEWPPKSGRAQLFPEIDRASWFSLPEACKKINSAQVGLLTELQACLVL